MKNSINIPIFLSSDDNYAPFVATTIASICNNTKSYIEFYILDSGIFQKNQQKIKSLTNTFKNFSIEFITIDSNKYFENFIETDYISKAMYNRFLIPELKPQIDRAIYSDIDVIVLGDISEMYFEDLEGYTIGAMWEEYAEGGINEKRKEYMNLDKRHKYFCSGNLLINCKKWREQETTQKLQKLENIYRKNLLNPDQDLLNKCFENNYKLLDSKYCYINQNYFFYQKHNPLIRHYNGKIKPWHIDEDSKTNLLEEYLEFWKYAKMTPFYTELKEQTKDPIKQQQLLRFLQISRIQKKSNCNIHKECK